MNITTVKLKSKSNDQYNWRRRSEDEEDKEEDVRGLALAVAGGAIEFDDARPRRGAAQPALQRAPLVEAATAATTLGTAGAPKPARCRERSNFKGAVLGGRSPPNSIGGS